MPLEIAILVAVAAFVLLLICLSGYVKAPPDVAYIISGVRKQTKVVVGRASVRIPFFERLDKLPLSLMQVDIKTASAVPTEEYINIFVDGVANIKVKDDFEHIRLASQNFLGRSKEEIAMVAQQVLEGNMREIIGQMKLSELVQNRDKFANMVLENAAGDMARMGLEIVNLTIQNFVDQNDVIVDLGMDNVVTIKKEAAIAKARGERDIEIASSQAREEANMARTDAEAKIEKQNNDLAIRKAELKQLSDTRQAEADSAYDIQKQEQRRQIEVASINADIARTDREVELGQRRVEVQEKMLTAEVEKKADSDRYAQQQRAEAELFVRMKDAEAQRYETEQRAAAEKARADAARYAREQEAEGIRAVGLAEAEAVDRKAAAMLKMGEASVIEMYLDAMPDIVKNAAEPLAKTEKIIMYGDGNSAKLVGDVMRSGNQIVDGVSDMTGLDLRELIGSFVAGKTAGNTVSAALDARSAKAMDPANSTTPPAMQDSPAEPDPTPVP